MPCWEVQAYEAVSFGFMWNNTIDFLDKFDNFFASIWNRFYKWILEEKHPGPLF